METPEQDRIGELLQAIFSNMNELSENHKYNFNLAFNTDEVSKINMVTTLPSAKEAMDFLRATHDTMQNDLNINKQLRDLSTMREIFVGTEVICVDDTNPPEGFTGDWPKKGDIYHCLAVQADTLNVQSFGLELEGMNPSLPYETYSAWRFVPNNEYNRLAQKTGLFSVN
jgi:hypothetical protein